MHMGGAKDVAQAHREAGVSVQSSPSQMRWSGLSKVLELSAAAVVESGSLLLLAAGKSGAAVKSPPEPSLRNGISAKRSEATYTHRLSQVLHNIRHFVIHFLVICMYNNAQTSNSIS